MTRPSPSSISSRLPALAVDESPRRHPRSPRCSPSRPADRYPPLELSPQQKKERTFQALLRSAAGLAATQPVLVLYEDVHWADPTTLELLGRVIERGAAPAGAALVTYRPEFAPPWARHGSHHAVAQPARAAQAADRRAGDGRQGATAEVLEQILARTDGVPLFVEELTKAVLESGLLLDAGDRYELAGPLPASPIPSTLQDSLMARLDRLAPVKEVAQIARL